MPSYAFVCHYHEQRALYGGSCESLSAGTLNFFRKRRAHRWVQMASKVATLPCLACLAWSFQGLDLNKPMLGIHSEWHLRVGWIALPLLGLATAQGFQGLPYRDVRTAKDLSEKTSRDLWSHLYVKTGDECCDEDLKNLMPSLKERILCVVAIAQACMNIFFYIYNFLALPKWGSTDHLQVSKHVIAWIEVVFASASFLSLLFFLMAVFFSGSSYYLLGFTSVMNVTGKFSCLKLLPVVEPGRVVDRLITVWKGNADLLQNKGSAILSVSLVSIGLVLPLALGLLALQVKVSQVASVGERPPDTWTWDELLRFLGFANNIMSINDLDVAKMNFLAGLVRDEVDRATAFGSPEAPGTRFCAWKRIIIETMHKSLTAPEFFAFCATLSAEKLAAQIIGVKELEIGSPVRLAVPSVLKEGSVGTICQLKPLMVEWVDHIMPRSVRLEGFTGELSEACGLYTLSDYLCNNHFPVYRKDPYELVPVVGNRHALCGADGWELRNTKGVVAWCLGIFMYSPAGEYPSWWATWHKNWTSCFSCRISRNQRCERVRFPPFPADAFSKICTLLH